MLKRTVGNYELRDAFCVYICGFLYALVFFSPNSQKGLYFIEARWRACSVQLPYTSLEFFAAASLLGLVVRKDDKFNAPTSLNLHLLLR